MLNSTIGLSQTQSVDTTDINKNIATDSLKVEYQNDKKSNTEVPEKKDEGFIKQICLEFIIIGLFVALVAVVAIFLISWKKQKKKSTERERLFEDFTNKFNVFQSKIEKLELAQSRFEEKNIKMEEAIADCKKTLIISDFISEESVEKLIKSVKKLYADAISNGEFYNMSNTPGDLSVYELVLVNDTNATFTVYAAAEKRVVARPGNLEGCEADIMQGGKSLQTIKPGEACEIGGKWKVITSLKVRIE